MVAAEAEDNQAAGEPSAILSPAPAGARAKVAGAGAAAAASDRRLCHDTRQGRCG